MYGSYYVDSQIIKGRQADIMQEVQHNYLVAEAKQTQPKGRIFRFITKATQPRARSNAKKAA